MGIYNYYLATYLIDDIWYNRVFYQIGKMGHFNVSLGQSLVQSLVHSNILNIKQIRQNLNE